MHAISTASWTAEQPRLPRNPTRVPRFDAASALFAAIALSAATWSATMEQTAEPRTNSAEQSNVSSATPLPAPAGAEWMFAGYGGVPYTYPSDVTLTKSGLHDVTAKQVAWDGKPFVNPIYYGARIVRFGAGRTGTMLDFTHSKTIARLQEEIEFAGTLNGAPAPARATLRDIFRRLEASHGHNMLTLNGLFRLPSLGLRLQPYVGIGAGVSLPHAEVQMANSDKRTYEYQVAGPVGQALLGLEVRTQRVSYFFEYKFTLAPYVMPLSEQDGSWLPLDLARQLRNWLSGEEPPGGHASTTLISHQGIFGLGIRSAPIVAAP
jgi:lipid A oxidase